MGRQTVTPEQWLAGIEVADENPTIRNLARQTLHQLWFRKSQAEHLDRRLQQLAPLCPCDKGDLPLRECPLHGDGKTFVAEVRELAKLRARIDAVVQEWRDAPDDVEPRSGVRSAWPELGAALDALMEGGLMPPIPAPCCGCNCTACHSGNCCKKD